MKTDAEIKSWMDELYGQGGERAIVYKGNTYAGYMNGYQYDEPKNLEYTQNDLDGRFYRLLLVDSTVYAAIWEPSEEYMNSDFTVEDIKCELERTNITNPDWLQAIDRDNVEEAVKENAYLIDSKVIGAE